MLNRMNAEIRGLRINWRGAVKNKTSGLMTPTCQAMAVAADGKVDIMYIRLDEKSERLKQGDLIDANVSISAFKDGLFLNMNEYVMHEEKKAQVKV